MAELKVNSSLDDVNAIIEFRKFIWGLDIPSTAKLVAFAVLAHIPLGKTEASPKSETLALMCGLEIKAVRRHLRTVRCVFDYQERPGKTALFRLPAWVGRGVKK